MRVIVSLGVGDVEGKAEGQTRRRNSDFAARRQQLGKLLLQIWPCGLLQLWWRLEV